PPREGNRSRPGSQAKSGTALPSPARPVRSGIDSGNVDLTHHLSGKRLRPNSGLIPEMFIGSGVGSPLGQNQFRPGPESPAAPTRDPLARIARGVAPVRPAFGWNQ